MGRNCSCIGHAGRLGSLSACMCLGFQVSIRWVHPTVRPASRTNINAMLRVSTYTHTEYRGGRGEDRAHVHTYQPGPDQRHVSGTRKLFKVINIRKKYGKAGRDTGRTRHLFMV